MFTDCGAETIEVLIGRNRYGRQVTEALIEYINMRVELEKSIAKGLEKLADFEFPTLLPIMKKALKSHGGSNNAIGGKDVSEVQLGTALLGIQKDLADQAKTHKLFAKGLETNILAHFKKSFSAQIGTKMKHKYRLFDATESITKNSKKLIEMKKANLKFSQRVRECEVQVDADPVNHRISAELDRAINAVTQADQKIRDAESALESKRKNLRKDILEATEDIVSAEYQRINLTVSTMMAFAEMIKAHDGASIRFAGQMAERFDKVSGKIELAEFRDRYILPFLNIPAETSYMPSRSGHGKHQYAQKHSFHQLDDENDRALTAMTDELYLASI